MTLSRLLSITFAALVLAACERGSTGSRPPVVSEDDLVFIRSAANAPPLVSTDTSFWVNVEDGRDVRIRYADGENGLEFKVPGRGLLRRPDGTAFRGGDSVQIRIRLAEPGTFNFEFQPAGLRFDPDRPAELRIRYKYANPDFNGDGRVDSADQSYDFGLWRQEAAGQPWEGLVTIRDADFQEVRADVLGFSKFAMAGD